MRALVLTGPRQAVVRDEPAPEPGPGEVVVTVDRVGVCGTDFELFTGELAYFAEGKSAYPLRPGHEWAGRVSALGAGVEERWRGARVTGDTMLPCGRCRLCGLGRGHVCPDRFEIGIRGGWPGALAERLVVPAQRLHALPDGIDDQAGALVEPGANAWRAAMAADARPGTRVLVLGPGTIGLLTAAFAAAMGAEVHVLGLDRAQEELAGRMGVAEFWTHGWPPEPDFDAVVECSGDRRAPATALGYVLPGGRLVYIGVASGPSLVDTRGLVFADVTVVGILSGSPGLAPAIRAYADGSVDPRPLVGATVGLDDAPAVLAGKLRAQTGTKVHIDPRG